MAQIFHRSFNVVSKVSIFGALIFVALLGWIIAETVESPYVTNVRVAVHQPVPFSHQHHVGVLGIDCRYCHTSVEESAFAGMPSTKICMNCHSQIWVGSAMLEPVRESYRTGRPIAWNRVHRVPDFTYFNHSIHVQKGVACVTCHGRVDQMPLIWQEHTLYMSWCLDCHRQPERHVRPREQVFSMTLEPTEEQRAAAAAALLDDDELMRAHRTQRLTDCSTCHR
jgi:hypothetical protein